MSVFRIICSLICLLSMCLIVGFGCGDDEKSTVGPSTQLGPSDPYPANRANNVPTMTTIAWTYSDTLADSLFYDLYLGKTNPPPLYMSRLTGTSVVVGPLDIQSNYYWKVIAYHTVGDSFSSTTWRFTTESSLRFPTVTGNNWEYFRVFAFSEVEPPYGLIYDTAYGTSTVEILGLDTLSDTVETIIFRTEWTNDKNVGSAETYRLHQADGLYVYAYDGLWSGPPKNLTTNTIYYECNGMRFSKLDDLLVAIREGGYLMAKSPLPNLIIEDPPIRELAYPLTVGQRWTFRDTDLGHVWDMEKEVVGMETVTVTAGLFECYKIRWFWDMDYDGEWDSDVDGYDYICSAGIVKRRFVYPPFYVTDEYGDTLGVIESTDDYELTGYELNSPPNN